MSIEIQQKSSAAGAPVHYLKPCWATCWQLQVTVSGYCNPNWLKLSISKVIQSCSAKLNTAQLCLLTQLVCISIIPQDPNRMRLTHWLLTVHFSFVGLWFFTASGNIWLYNLVLVNRANSSFLKRAQSDAPLFHRSFFLLRNSVRGGVFLDESLSSSSLNSNKICQFIILQG